MNQSVRALMTAVVDYAGLFPPAKLPLDQVVCNYAEYRRCEHAWALGRLICPAQRLGELWDLIESASGDEIERPWLISALGRGGQDSQTFIEGVSQDAAAMVEWLERSKGLAVSDAFETRLPQSVVADDDTTATRDLVRRAADSFSMLVDALPVPLRVFFEIPFSGDWRRDVERAIAAVAEARRHGTTVDDRIDVGVKIRTGGVESSAVPPVEQVAFFIGCCRRHAVAFKATAGLHHPIRLHSTEIDGKMHGFLNVFAAAILAQSSKLSEAELIEVLEREVGSAFGFSDQNLTFGEHRATPADIQSCRSNFAISFGSCSFTQPIEDLRVLGLV